jgi:hypothetical protein
MYHQRYERLCIYPSAIASIKKKEGGASGGGINAPHIAGTNKARNARSSKEHLSPESNWGLSRAMRMTEKAQLFPGPNISAFLPLHQLPRFRRWNQTPRRHHIPKSNPVWVQGHANIFLEFLPAFFLNFFDQITPAQLSYKPCSSMAIKSLLVAYLVVLRASMRNTSSFVSASTTLSPPADQGHYQ